MITDKSSEKRREEANESLKNKKIKHEIFADPTLDVTFKMLFGTEKHKDILINLLNSLLNFIEDKVIIDIEINNNELEVSNVSNRKEESGITSAVDILCTTKGQQKIAIEMQGQRQKYFLTREQEYMAKLIAGQVKEGEGKLYHERVLDTYIIVIGKQNMFAGQTKLKNQELFELDVEPRVVQTNETYPNNKMHYNKMHWKFFELPKFKESQEFKTITKSSIMKYQWLEFLIECNNQTTEPDRNELIKKGYDIMETANWDYDTQVLYWKQKANFEDDLMQKEYDKEEAFEKGMVEGQIKGQIKGEIKGQIKGEIKQIKMMFELNIAPELFISKLNFLTQEPIKSELDNNLNYIKEHLTYSEDQICNDLNLLGAFIQED